MSEALSKADEDIKAQMEEESKTAKRNRRKKKAAPEKVEEQRLPFPKEPIQQTEAQPGSKGQEQEEQPAADAKDASADGKPANETSVAAETTKKRLTDKELVEECSKAIKEAGLDPGMRKEGAMKIDATCCS